MATLLSVVARHTTSGLLGNKHSNPKTSSAIKQRIRRKRRNIQAVIRGLTSPPYAYSLVLYNTWVKIKSQGKINKCMREETTRSIDVPGNDATSYTNRLKRRSITVQRISPSLRLCKKSSGESCLAVLGTVLPWPLHTEWDCYPWKEDYGLSSPRGWDTVVMGRLRCSLGLGRGCHLLGKSPSVMGG